MPRSPGARGRRPQHNSVRPKSMRMSQRPQCPNWSTFVFLGSALRLRRPQCLRNKSVRPKSLRQTFQDGGLSWPSLSMKSLRQKSLRQKSLRQKFLRQKFLRQKTFQDGTLS